MTLDNAAHRTAASARRKAVHGVVDPGPARRALLAEIARLGATCVSGYAPIRTEIDPSPIHDQLNAQGVALCLPVVQAAGQPLSFRAWRPGDAMVPGAFCAPIPEADVAAVPDLLITPLLAFDTKGYRLGYGGGFYDRTLEILRTEGRAIALGFAYDAQRVDQVPREPTDQRLDAIVTEVQVYRAAP